MTWILHDDTGLEGILQLDCEADDQEKGMAPKV